jgi:hypothetical protein
MKLRHGFGCHQICIGRTAVCDQYRILVPSDTNDTNAITGNCAGRQFKRSAGISRGQRVGDVS